MGTAAPERDEPPRELGFTKMRRGDDGERVSAPERTADREGDRDWAPMRWAFPDVADDLGVTVIGPRRTGCRLGVVSVRRLVLGAEIRFPLLVLLGCRTTGARRDVPVEERTLDAGRRLPDRTLGAALRGAGLAALRLLDARLVLRIRGALLLTERDADREKDDLPRPTERAEREKPELRLVPREKPLRPADREDDRESPDRRLEMLRDEDLLREKERPDRDDRPTDR